MLANIAYLDFHSMSIYDHLAENSEKVTWFPIDLPAFDHVANTLQFIEQYTTIPDEIKHWFLTVAPTNISTGLKKQYVNRLLEIPPSSQILKYIDFDQCLYDQIVTQLLGNYPE
jgi:hypothetical protein